MYPFGYARSRTICLRPPNAYWARCRLVKRTRLTSLQDHICRVSRLLGLLRVRCSLDPGPLRSDYRSRASSRWRIAPVPAAVSMPSRAAGVPATSWARGHIDAPPPEYGATYSWYNCHIRSPSHGTAHRIARHVARAARSHRRHRRYRRAQSS